MPNILKVLHPVGKLHLQGLGGILVATCSVTLTCISGYLLIFFICLAKWLVNLAKSNGDGKKKEKNPARINWITMPSNSIWTNLAYVMLAKDWITDDNALRLLTYLDKLSCFWTEYSTYTLGEFKNWKSLELYEQFCSGWV